MAALSFTPGEEVCERVLEGRHVRLEPLRERHFEGLLAAAQHPTERFALTAVRQDPEGMRRWLGQALAQAQKLQALPFATIDRRDGAVVGSTRFGNLEFWEWQDEPRRRPLHNPDAVEIGWTWLAPRAQRTGINSEAKLLMLGHAFEAWRVFRVTIKTDARNQRSRDAIARLGARLDGVLRAHLPASDGTVRDTALYSITAAQWPEVKARLEDRLRRGGE